MIRVVDVLGALESAAPSRYAADYDNVGFLVGRGEREVTRAIVALDVTSRAINEACDVGANLIVAHHPVIFNPRKSITDGDTTGALLMSLIENGISAICMHTNLDCAHGGVNDALAAALGVHTISPIEPSEDENVGGGRYGYIDGKCDLHDFLEIVCRSLSANGLRYFDALRKVHKVAVGGGSCGSYLGRVAALGCDTFVTADVKHDTFLAAEELGINIIDAGHFATEDVVCPCLAEIIRSAFPTLDIKVAASDRDCVEFFTR